MQEALIGPFTRPQEFQAGIAEGKAHRRDLSPPEGTWHHAAGRRATARHNAGASLGAHALQADIGFRWPVDGIFDGARAGCAGYGEARPAPP
jgi:hypothetical protein